MIPREHKALAFIEGYIADAGYAPTLAEIAVDLGLASRSGVHRVLTSLERQGRIVRDKARPRAITILKGTDATGARTIADILAPISTEALRMELTRRTQQEVNHG